MEILTDFERRYKKIISRKPLKETLYLLDQYKKSAEKITMGPNLKNSIKLKEFKRARSLEKIGKRLFERKNESQINNYTQKVQFKRKLLENKSKSISDIQINRNSIINATKIINSTSKIREILNTNRYLTESNKLQAKKSQLKLRNSNLFHSHINLSTNENNKNYTQRANSILKNCDNFNTESTKFVQTQRNVLSGYKDLLSKIQQKVNNNLQEINKNSIEQNLNEFSPLMRKPMKYNKARLRLYFNLQEMKIKK